MIPFNMMYNMSMSDLKWTVGVDRPEPPSFLTTFLSYSVKVCIFNTHHKYFNFLLSKAFTV